MGTDGHGHDEVEVDFELREEEQTGGHDDLNEKLRAPSEVVEHVVCHKLVAVIGQ